MAVPSLSPLALDREAKECRECPETKAARLEKELDALKRQYLSQLREFSAMASLRETIAASVLQVTSSSPNEYSGPGYSPGETNVSSQNPPHGAEDPSQNKLNRWISRSQEQNRSSPIAACNHAEPSESEGKLSRWISRASGKMSTPESCELCPSGKLSRWINRAQKGVADADVPPSKLNRWLDRAKTSDSSPASQPAARGSSHDWSEVSAHNGSFEEEVTNLAQRIRHAWGVVDAALALRSNAQRPVEREESSETDDGSDSQPQTTNGLRCPSCGVELSAIAEPAAAAAGGDGAAADGGGFRGLGLRVEEVRKGLAVTHVVPDGLADAAGFMVQDLIQTVDGQPVRGLKAFGERVRDGAGAGRLSIDVLRGSGAARRGVSLHVRTRELPPGPQGERPPAAAGEADAEGPSDRGNPLLASFLSARRGERAREKLMGTETRSVGPGAAAQGGPAGKRGGAKFNKYGKDTKLWVPESEALVAEGPGGGGRALLGLDGGGGGGGGKGGKLAEIGGFYFFPPGHPDYVPLPPGEAALIAGRQDVHPQERLAPHWSHVVFQSPSGAEIRAQARHATYGSIDAVSGRLVPADPLIAHQDLNNAAEVAGSVVYVKRGGAPFTKKARVAVAAGAVACIVANHDRETFGMSYTDDGLPFAALNIPCVMISSDIAEKLEASAEWRVTLTPAKPEQQGLKQPPKHDISAAASAPDAAQPHAGAAAAAATAESPAGPAAAAAGMGLRGLPVKPKGGGLGKPGAKPTMWKKIRLFLP